MGERYTAVVIGAGQAGLSTSYYLKQAGIDHVVLDAGARVGDAWRQRWDSLRLFTPAAWDGLPGMPYPASSGYIPSKEEMAAYLET
ncbi:MAG: FAD-dependent oxidoreductase [Candidatus Limnocylindria bacterium]